MEKISIFLNVLTQASGILMGLFLFALLMVLHELGHFLTGLWLGFEIEEFSIFLGPKILGFQKNGIQYSLRCIPLGAFVKFKGEMNGAIEEEGLSSEKTSSLETGFSDKPIWKRFFVIFNGPLVNILSGFLSFFILFSFLGYYTSTLESPREKTLSAQAGLLESDELVQLGEHVIHNDLDLRAFLLMDQKLYQGRDLTFKFLRQEENGKVLHEVTVPWKAQTNYRLGVYLEKEYFKGGEYFKISQIPESRKSLISLQEDDVILEVNGIPMTENNRPLIAESFKKDIAQVKILRPIEDPEKTLTFEVPLETVEEYAPLGLSLQKSYHLGGALKAAYHYSFSIIKMTFKSIVYMVKGRLAASESLSGPVGVVHAISQVSTSAMSLDLRIIALVEMFALLSISIGLMNLFPIPPLDGFLIVSLVIETLRGGKKMSYKTISRLTMVGIVMMLLLFVFGFYFDLLRLLK